MLEVGEALSKLKARLLYLVWRKQRSGDGRMCSPQELLTQVTTGQSAADFSSLSLKKIQTSLRRLEEIGVLDSAPGVKENESAPGPPPRFYRLPEAGKVITWQSTARLVLELLDNPHRPVDREQFIADIIKLGLCQDDTNTPSTREEIRMQIEYCIRKGYLRIEAESDHPSGLASGGSLQCTSLVDQHWEFLSMIATPKRPAAAEPSNSSRDSTAAPGAGTTQT